MPRKWQMERLEDRRLLAVDVQVLSGDLVVSGNATGAVEITAQADGSYVVTEGGTAVGTYTGVTDDIKVTLDSEKASADDRVTIDLGGAKIDSLTVSLGNGDNVLNVKNGTVESGLIYQGAEGNDALDIAADATIAKNVDVFFGSGDNQFELSGKVERALNIRAGSGDDELC